MFKRDNFERLEDGDFDYLLRTHLQIKKIIKTILGITIIAFTLIILFSFFSNIKLTKKQMIQTSLKNTFQLNTSEIIPVKVNVSGNGFYTFKLENIPDVEVHAVFSAKDDIFIHDMDAKLHKYFFEKWMDSDKYKFTIEEKYEDLKYNLTTKKNWLLQYNTYINVNNYNELLDAIDAIIRFKKFMGDDTSSILINNYIRISDELILSQKSAPLSYDEIKKSIIEEYIQIVKNKNLNSNDIPLEIWNQ